MFYLLLSLCLCLSLSLQAISNPNSEEHQEAAWQTVLPLVSQLRKFYEYALELETALCQLLSVLCSPEMDALSHLEQQQVSSREKESEGGKERDERERENEGQSRERGREGGREGLCANATLYVSSALQTLDS